MKKLSILTLSLFLTLFQSSLFAQDISVLQSSEDNRIVCPGEQWCANVYLNSISESIIVDRIQFNLTWDSSALSFDNLNLEQSDFPSSIESITEDNFDRSSGSLEFDWQGNEELVQVPQFEICWQVLENFDQLHSPTIFLNEGNILAGSSNIPIGPQLSSVPIFKPSIQIESRKISVEHEQICLPLIARNFQGAKSANFTLAWDENLLAFNSVNLENSEFDGLTTEDFTTDTAGQLGVSWAALNGDNIDFENFNGYIPSAVLMYKVCFDVLIDTPTTTTIDIIKDDPNYPIVASSDCTENSIIESISGHLDVIEQATGIYFPDSTISNNTEVLCIPAQIRNYESVVTMQFTTAWDSEVLSFKEVKLDKSILSDLSAMNFNGQNEGLLLFSWFDLNLTGLEVQANDILFETCFDVIGDLGDETPIFLGGDTLGIITEVVTELGELLVILDEPGRVRIRGEERFIFPGDANEDKQSNHFDLLHIGLGYNAFGTERANNDISWERKYSRDWGETSPVSTVNYKHSDTNGDSKVDELDIEAIERNWGQFETVGGNVYVPQNFVGEAVLAIEDVEPSFGDADYTLPILLGTETASTEQAYGLAFSISYDYEGGTLNEDWISLSVQDSWLGTLGEDLIAIDRHFPNENRIDIALTRIDRVARSGAGQIAELGLILEDVILLLDRGDTESKIDLRIHDIRLINEQEQEIEVPETQLSIDLSSMATSINVLGNTDKLSIYPNITTDYIHIESKIAIEEAIILDINGKTITRQEQPTHTLNVQSLASGAYMLQLITKEGVATRRFNIQ